MQQYKVVVVDDDEDDRQVMAEAFQEIGFMDYLILPSADAMITFFDSISDAQQYPSVLVTDLNMPRMNGLQLIQALRKKPEGKHLHIAVYSTSTLDSDKETCLAAGANAFIVKPLSFAGYCQIAENLLAGLNLQASFRS